MLMIGGIEDYLSEEAFINRYRISFMGSLLTFFVLSPAWTLVSQYCHKGSADRRLYAFLLESERELTPRFVLNANAAQVAPCMS